MFGGAAVCLRGRREEGRCLLASRHRSRESLISQNSFVLLVGTFKGNTRQSSQRPNAACSRDAWLRQE